MTGLLTAGVVFLYITVAVTILQFPHWIGRKILRKPKIGFRRWIRSWIAGPELLVGGFILLMSFHATDPDFKLPIVIFIFVELLGFSLLIVKSITYIISRLYRQFSAAPGVQRTLNYGPHLAAQAPQPPLQQAAPALKPSGEPETI
jgi:hypothetical protein